jgi:hypothetical protein
MVVDMKEWKRNRLGQVAMRTSSSGRIDLMASFAIIGGLSVGAIVPAVRNWSLNHAFPILLIGIIGWGLYEMSKSTSNG